uniref:Uncharacterized protein n=1 Tax=Passalora fulva TaxID=5499 RepID=A0A9Q8P787_PASFU
MPKGRVFTEFEKGEMWSLHKHAHWPLQQIADALHTNKGSVSSVISRLERVPPSTPKKRGPPPVINTSRRQRLVY